VIVEFEVVGVPAPQGSKTAYAIPGKNGARARAVVVEGTSQSGRERHANWRDAVTTAARAAGITFDEPVWLGIVFRMPPVKSDPYRSRHATSPDLSKLVRCTEDALVASGVLRDDSLVCQLEASKDYAQRLPVGASIRIEGLGAMEARDREAMKAAAREARKVVSS
jgi:Holliday junction resolvase RusA-like endonuclease